MHRGAEQRAWGPSLCQRQVRKGLSPPLLLFPQMLWILGSNHPFPRWGNWAARPA